MQANMHEKFYGKNSPRDETGTGSFLMKQTRTINQTNPNQKQHIVHETLS